MSDMRDQGLERLREGLRRDLGGVCLSALNDSAVVELMLNPDGSVWVDKLGAGMVDTGFVMPASQGMKILTTVASMLGVIVNQDQPIVEGELPLDGSRFEGLSAPVVGAPTFAIRKKASLVFTLEDYRDKGILTGKNDPRNFKGKRQIDSFSERVKGLSHYEVLMQAVLARKNILVVGSTGSGKTTFVNAVLAAVAGACPDQRLVIIEDTGEIQCHAKNYVTLRATHRVNMTQLLRATMRLRPDRIVVGEVRGGEALALLKAWNTGHPGGLATVHANDCEAGLVRMEQLIQEAVDVVNPQLIAEAVDVVVFIDKDSGLSSGRKVRDVAIVNGYDQTSRCYCLEHV